MVSSEYIFYFYKVKFIEVEEKYSYAELPVSGLLKCPSTSAVRVCADGHSAVLALFAS